MSASNSTMSDIPPILNPNTPLAYFTPEQAYQTSVAIYVLAGSAGVLLWDVLDNITADFKIIFKSRFTLSTAAYIASRIGSLGYVIACNIFQTAPTGNCVHFETINDAFYPIALGCSAFLFFLRLRAIYNRDRIVVGCFFILWCGLLACTIFIPAGVLGGTIGPTKYCIDADVPILAYAAIIAPLVHDTLVFIAISWRLMQNTSIESGNFKDNLQTVLYGKYLPAFSKSLLLDGQRYYLITLVSNMVTVIMVFDTTVPIPLRSMSATPNIVITSIMACRVYRRTRAGLFREVEISTTTMSIKNRNLISAQPIRVDIEMRNDTTVRRSNAHSSDTALAQKARISEEGIHTKDSSPSSVVVDIEKGL